MSKEPLSWWNTSLSIVHSISWIVGSTFVCTSIGYILLQSYFVDNAPTTEDGAHHLRWIVQTGPEKEPLKSSYLCELLGISSDKPIEVSDFCIEEGEKKLLSSPLIKEASIKLVFPNTICVDYTVRRPLASLYDYTNTYIDEEGYLFPNAPFFSPKTLPEIYLGLEEKTSSSIWKTKMQGEAIELAFAILHYLDQPIFREAFMVKRIDVSSAFAESYGKREIVVELLEPYKISQGEEKNLQLSRLLRLSTKGYEQELLNYLQLRPTLLENQADHLQQKIIDFRVSQLAFIEDGKSPT